MDLDLDLEEADESGAKEIVHKLSEKSRRDRLRFLLVFSSPFLFDVSSSPLNILTILQLAVCQIARVDAESSAVASRKEKGPQR
jgi:predicted RNA polymerase sigma factor